VADLPCDNRAWEALILRYRRLVYSIPLAGFRFQTADADEIFQAVCLKLLQHFPEVKDEDRLGAWLRQVTTHECIHLLRRKQSESSAEQPNQNAPDPTENIEMIRVEAERRQAIRDAIQDLRAPCPRLLELLFLHQTGLPYDEIARQLGMKGESSVGPNRARCLDELRKLLRKRGYFS
jgi:RNA polymerase sigma factor (sigma-70 family)